MTQEIYEPILLDIDLSIEEYDFDVDDESTFDFDTDTEIRIISTEGERYEGSYEVTPTFYQQTLETNNKVMSDDVIIHPIAVSTVSNPAGGNTVYIGGL